MTPNLLKIVVFLGGLLGLFGFGYKVGSNHVQAKWNEQNIETDKKINQLVAQAREKEQVLNAKLVEAENRYDKIVQESRTAADAIRRNGLYVRTTSCSNVPRTSSGSSISDAGTTARLSDEDAEFLVSQALKANEIVAQLTACQAILKSERE